MGALAACARQRQCDSALEFVSMHLLLLLLLLPPMLLGFFC